VIILRNSSKKLVGKYVENYYKIDHFLTIMTKIDDIIDKLQTDEGRRQAQIRGRGGIIDPSSIIPFMSRANYFMEMAKSHEKKGDKKEADINYRQAMLSYEKAGVFSYAENIARIIGDDEMVKVYHDVILHVR